MDEKVIITVAEGLFLFAKNFTKVLNFDDYCLISEKIETKLNHDDPAQVIEGAQECVNLKECDKFYLEDIWKTTVKTPSESVVETIKVQNEQKVIEELKEYLKKSKVEMANKTMKDYTKANSFLIITEVAFLIDTWNEIKECENVIFDEDQFKTIDESIQNMLKLLKELDDENDKKTASILNLLSIKYGNAMKELSEIRLKDTGSKLNLRYKTSLCSSFTNGVHTMSGLINIVRLWKELSTWNKIFGSLTTAGFALITGIHARNAILTDARIKELGVKLKELEEKEQRLKKIGIKIEEAILSSMTK